MIALTLCLALGVLPRSTSWVEDLKRVERSLQQLTDLQARVREGYLPTFEDLQLERSERHDVLASLDATAAARVSMPPDQLRARLLPGFLAELRMLSSMTPDQAESELPQPSPVLTQLLDVEEQMTREAVKTLYRRGIANPLESGALSDPAFAKTISAEEAGPEAAAPAPASEAAEMQSMDPALRAETLYAARRFGEALDLYQKLDLPLGEKTLLVHYRIADCLLNLGRNAEAAQKFQALATGYPETTVGKDARWAADYAAALAGLDGPSGEHKR